MKKLVFLLLTSLPLLAADPIPADKQEVISREMLTLQQAQIALQGVQLEATQAITQAQQRVRDQQAKYDALVVELQKTYKAEGCTLPLTKVWQCPQAPAKQEKSK